MGEPDIEDSSTLNEFIAKRREAQIKTRTYPETLIASINAAGEWTFNWPRIEIGAADEMCAQHVLCRVALAARDAGRRGE